MMLSNVLTYIILAVLILIVLKFSYLVFPVVPLRPGEKISVFMDNKFNRTATVSKNTVDGVVIYGKMLLPINYRGRFYAIGYLEDGHKLLYVTNKYRFLALFSELLRKTIGIPPYNDPTIEKTEEEEENG